MNHLDNHINNAKDFQLENTLVELRTLFEVSKNPLTKNIAITYINKCSLKLNSRK